MARGEARASPLGPSDLVVEATAYASRGGRVMSKVVPGFYLRPEWVFEKPPIDALDALRELGVI